jgi:hypothetical protein
MHPKAELSLNKLAGAFGSRFRLLYDVATQGNQHPEPVYARFEFTQVRAASG